MELLAVSISHENTPISIREKVSFTKKKQAEILKYIKQNIAEECVLLSTCNRCEFYLAGYNMKDKFIDCLVSLTDEFVKKYISIYEGDDCSRHLALTASGLKSMILGEDQILGQVKDAHEFAKEHLCCGKYLNTLFRISVTGAKKVKTETLLSKTPVSAATIAIKQCQNILGTLNSKNILIIGASGKTGSIVLKDLLSLDGVNIYATSRTHDGIINHIDGAITVDYDKRYDNLDMYDAVISATSSPHIVLEKSRTKKAIKTCKKRVFIDLAVPRDNRIKQQEIIKAEKILQKYIDEFRIWKLFSESETLFKSAENKIENESEKNTFRHKIYNLKSDNNYAKFSEFIILLREKLT